MKNRHDRNFKVLEEFAENMIPTYRNYRVVSMITYKRKIISIGKCGIKTHPLQKRFQKHPDCISLHAEIDAIAKALKSLSYEEMKKSSIYVLRLKNDEYSKRNIIGMSKPCEGCNEAISEYGIRNVYYTNDYGEYERL